MIKFVNSVLNVIMWNLLALYFLSLVVHNAAGREIPAILVIAIPIYMAFIFINAENAICIDEKKRELIIDSLVDDINDALSKSTSLRVKYTHHY